LRSIFRLGMFFLFKLSPIYASQHSPCLHLSVQGHATNQDTILERTGVTKMGRSENDTA